MSSSKYFDLSKIKANDFITLDLEYTSWRNSLKNNWSDKNQYKEIVQLGLYFENKSKSISFNKYFLPKLNPKLSIYFQKLTKITNAFLIKNNSNYKETLEEVELLTSKHKFIFCIGSDKEVLIENNLLKNIEKKYRFIDKIIDIRPTIAKYLGLKINYITSSGLPNYFNLKSNDNLKHSAIYDAKCSYQSILKIVDSYRINKNI